MARRMTKRLVLGLGVSAFALAQACSCSDEGESASNVPSSGGTGGTIGKDASQDTLIFPDGNGGEASTTCPGGCPEGQICISGFCVTQTACNDDDDCQNDTYCEPGVGCVPWGTPPGKDHDPNCQVGLPPGNFAPSIKCEFSTAPAGDPFPAHLDVQATPVVVNFNKPGQGVPSIVAPFTATVASNYTEDLGVIRVLRGDDCTLEANLGGGQAGYSGYVVSSSALAAADLDGDGAADIVANAADGRMVAFTRKAGAWSVLWQTPAPVAGACDGASHRCPLGWAGPSVHDLDDDGVPEVIREGTVIDGKTGALKGGPPAGYASHSVGLNPVLADLDQDPAIELTNGQYVWQWTAAGWTQETYFSSTGPGFVAVADFGAYGASLPATNPELGVVRASSVGIYAMDGTVVLGPIAVPGGGGGAPTIADYDGDGLPELGVAGQAFLTVYDIDCSATPRPNGKCANTNGCDDINAVAGACPAGILWSRRTQDISSNITGSSVFDFEDDGKAEVVYADECFVRVYDGTTGKVLFSQYRSSCTWYENPVVADTDGNFRADLVTPSNLACSTAGAGIACNAPLINGDGVDATFAGSGCQVNKDCPSNKCDQGYCRCATTAECCSAATDPACTDLGYKCAAPPAGLPGTGNTCRAAHPKGVQGIRVYQDATDRWVRSRTIWNQHAYAVTHVNEDGTVPKSSAWKKNWLDPTLNNFRQNVPGDASGQDIPDVTTGIAGFQCGSSGALLSAPVCNRGTAPIGTGVKVGFYDGTTKVCETATTKALNPGECETVSCVWTSPPTATPTDVKVISDDDSSKTECKEKNNEGTVLDVKCKPPA